MLFIRHRVNNSKDLGSVDKSHGVEIDLRSDVNTVGSIHVAHDPWQEGEKFSVWLAEFKKQKILGPLLMNTKEDGLEPELIKVLATEKIENYFFLDTTFPTFVKCLNKGLGEKFFFRISIFEPLSVAQEFKNQVKWLWADCFAGEPLSANIIADARKHFKVCLVSPELHGKSTESIGKFAKAIGLADAVCTKRPDLWAKA